MEGGYPSGVDASKTGQATAYSCGLCFKEFAHYRDLAIHERWHLEQMSLAGVLPMGHRAAFDNRHLYGGTTARESLEKAGQPFRSETELRGERSSTVERPQPYRLDTGVKLPLDVRAVTPVCEAMPVPLVTDLRGLTQDSHTISSGTVMSPAPAQLPIPTAPRPAVQSSPIDLLDTRSPHPSTPADAHTLSYNTVPYLEGFKAPVPSPLYSAHPLVRQDDVYSNTEPRNVLPKMDSQIYPNPDPYYSITKHLAGSSIVEKVESQMQPTVNIIPPTTMSPAQLAYYHHVRARQEKESSPKLPSYNNSPVMQSPRLSSTESAESHLPTSPEPQALYYAQPVSTPSTGPYQHPDQSRLAATPTDTVSYLHQDQGRHVSTPTTVSYLNQDLNKPVAPPTTSSIYQDFGAKHISTPTNTIPYLPLDIGKLTSTPSPVSYQSHDISKHVSISYLPHDINKPVSVPSSVSYLAHNISKPVPPSTTISHLPKQVYTPSTLSYLPHSLINKQEATPSPVSYLSHDVSKPVSTPSTIPYIAHDISKLVSMPSPSSIPYQHHGIAKPAPTCTTAYYSHHSHSKSVTATSTIPYTSDSISKHVSIPSPMPYAHQHIGKPIAAPNTISYLPHNAMKQMSPTRLPPYAYMPVASQEPFQLATAAQDYTAHSSADTRVPPSTTMEHSVLSIIQAHTALSQPDSPAQTFEQTQPLSIPSELVAQSPGGFKTYKENKHALLGKDHESLGQNRTYPGENTLPPYSGTFVSNDQFTQSTQDAGLSTHVAPGASNMMSKSQESTSSSDCHYCSMTFPTMKDLSAHLLIHEQQDRMTEKTGHAPSQLSNPNSHLPQNTYTMGKDLILRSAERVDSARNKICNICSKSFHNQNQLIEHMHVHSADETFACKFCHKAFATKSRCARHELIHTQTDGLIHCEVCDKVFQNKGSYLYHIKNHEKPVGELESKGNFAALESNSSLGAYPGVKVTTSDIESDAASHFDDLIKLSIEHMEEFKPDKVKGSSEHEGSNPHPYFQHISSDGEGSKYQEQGQNLTAESHNFSLNHNLVECPVCESEMDRCALFEHMATHNLHTCQQCEQAFGEKSEYVEHLMTFHWKDLVDKSDDENRNIGNVSPVKYTGDSNNVSVNKEQEVSQAAVENNAIRETIKSLLKRKPIVEPSTSPKEMPVYKCIECDITFTFKGEFQKHKLAHKRDARSVACQICDTSFYEKANYLYHMLEHVQEQDDDSDESEVTDEDVPKFPGVVECVNCRRSMEKGKLVDHMKIHIKYSCDECQKAFPHRRNYVQHLKSAHHEDVKDEDLPKVEMRPAKKERQNATSESEEHICEICTRAFASISQLNRHSVSHSKKRIPMSSCEICADVFYNKGSLLYHLRKHETTDLGEIATESEEFVKNMGLFPTSANADHSSNVAVDNGVADNAAVDDYAGVNLDSIDSGITSDEGNLEDRVLDSKEINDETISVHQYLDERTGNIVERTPSVHDEPGNATCSTSVGDDAMQEVKQSSKETSDVCNENRYSDHLKGSSLDIVDNDNVTQTSQVKSTSKIQHDDFKVVDNKPETSTTTERHAKLQDLHRGIVGKEFLNKINVADIRECNICKKYIVKTVFIDHLKIHKVHECDTCKKSFTQKRGYVYHMRAFHAKELLERGIDKDFNKEFKEVASFGGNKKENKTKTEIVKKSKHESLVCPVCSIECIDEDAYNEHTEVHESERFVCPVCAKEFTKRSSLVLHEATHDYVGHSKKGLPFPRACPLCNISIQSHRHYIDHSRMHTGDRPYKCPDCERDFSRNHNLEIHLKKQHNKDVKVSYNAEGEGIEFDTGLGDSRWNKAGKSSKTTQHNRTEKIAECTKDLVKQRHAKKSPGINTKKKHKYKRKRKINDNDNNTLREDGKREHVQNIQRRSRRVNYNEKDQSITRTRRSVKLINYNEDELMKRLETDSDTEPSKVESVRQKSSCSKGINDKGKTKECDITGQKHDSIKVQQKQRSLRNVNCSDEGIVQQNKNLTTEMESDVAKTRRASRNVNYNENKMAKRNKSEVDGKTDNHYPEKHKRMSSLNTHYSATQNLSETSENNADKYGSRKRKATLHNVSNNEKDLIKKNKTESSDDEKCEETSSRKRRASDMLDCNKDVKVKKSESIVEKYKGQRHIYNIRGGNKLKKNDTTVKKRKKVFMNVRQSSRILKVETTTETKLRQPHYGVYSTRKESSVKLQLKSKPIKNKLIKKSDCDKKIKDHVAEMGLKLNHTVNWTENAQGQLYSRHCPQCRLLIRSHNHYVEHSRFHTGVRPYACSGCKHAFSAERYRDKHEKTCSSTQCSKKETKDVTKKESELKGTKFANTSKKSDGETQTSEQKKNTRMNPEVRVVDINSSLANSSFTMVKDGISPETTESSAKTEMLPFSCEECGKSFKKKRDLYIHAKEHIADDQYSQKKRISENVTQANQGNNKLKTEMKSENNDNATPSDELSNCGPMDVSNQHDHNLKCKIEGADEDKRLHGEDGTTTSLGEKAACQSGELTETSKAEVSNVSECSLQIPTVYDKCNREKVGLKPSVLESDNKIMPEAEVETEVETAELELSCSSADRNARSSSTESVKSLKVKKMSSESALSKWRTKVHDVLSSQLELNDKRLRTSTADKNSKTDTGNSNGSAVVRDAGPSKFECRICGEVLDLEVDFITHMDVHLHETPPYCDICDIYFMAIYPKRRLIEHNKKKHGHGSEG